MRADMTRASRLRVAVLSLAGIISGHYITYLVMAPDAHARAELLSLTGHGPWMPGAYLAAALAVAGAFALVTGRRQERAGNSRGTGLIGVQCLGFAGLEITERWISHGLTTEILTDLPLWLGIAVQVAIALSAPLLIRVASRTIRRLITRLLDHARVPPTTPIVPSSYICHLVSQLLRNTRWLRGPPVSLLLS